MVLVLDFMFRIHPYRIFLSVSTPIGAELKLLRRVIINTALLPCKASVVGVAEGVGEGGGLVEPVKGQLLIFGTWTDPHRLVLASSLVIRLGV